MSAKLLKLVHQRVTWRRDAHVFSLIKLSRTCFYLLMPWYGLGLGFLILSLGFLRSALESNKNSS